jgi:hypothetical protein
MQQLLCPVQRLYGLIKSPRSPIIPIYGNINVYLLGLSRHFMKNTGHYPGKNID